VTRIDAIATNEEILRQKSLWVMEVTFKPMRMRWVTFTDPKTGKKERELIWYLVYKAVNRPLDRRKDTSNSKPNNPGDPVPPLMFVPEFTLVATDGGQRKIYHDQIIPKAYREILKRESRYEQPRLKHSVSAAGPVPPASPIGAEGESAIYGVAMWRGVDPDTDFFTVYMSGFSNSFDTVGELRGNKTIVHKYQRPGDRFFQTEKEFEEVSDGRIPAWPYQVYSTGTITVKSGDVTLAGGTWPQWAGEARLDVFRKGVAGRTSDAVRRVGTDGKLILEDTSANLEPGTSFELVRTKKVTFPAWTFWPEDTPAKVPQPKTATP